MKLHLPLSEETRRVLDELAEEGNLQAPELVHQWFREWLFQRPNPMSSSMAAQASALIQRGTLSAVNGKRWTAKQLEARIKNFIFPEDGAPAGALEVEISHRVGDVLPRCVAFADLTMPAAVRDQQGWRDLPSWAVELVTGRCAELGADMEAKEAADEEAALYPKRPRKQPEKGKPDA